MALASIETTIPIWLIGLAGNGALLLGSFAIARHGFRQERGLPAALGTAVIFWASSLVGLEVLGSLGAITAGWLLAVGVGVLAAGCGAWWYGRLLDRGYTGPPPAPADRPGPTRDAQDKSSRSLSWDALAGLALLVSASLILGMRALLLAVKVVSDGPIYHLYFAARWWRAGRLFLIAAPFGENAATYFPANGDLWFTWLITSWGGDRLARVGQAPFLVLAAVAAYGSARMVGAGRSASLVATCWFASSTPLLLFSFEPNVDTIFVAGYLMAVYFFLRASYDTSDRGALILGALAAGAALGTKAVGVVFIPALQAVALGVVLFQTVPIRIKVVRVLLVLLVPILTGGYWHLRNGLLTGNPLYPLEVRLLGRTVLPGWYGPDAMQFSPFYVPLQDWRALCDTLMAVLDPRLVPLWLAAVAGAWAVKNRQTGWSRRWTIVFSLLAIVNVALYWICIPYRTQQRFMLQALGLAVVPLALLFDRWLWLRYLGAVLLGAHLLVPQNWPFPPRDDAIPWDLSPAVPNAIDSPIPLFARVSRATQAPQPFRSALGLAILAAIVVNATLAAWAWNRFGSTSKRSWGRAAWALALSAVLLWLGGEYIWSDGLNARIVRYPPFPDFFIGWHNLERYAGPDGSRVAYAGTNIPYYLLGSGLRNQVLYINIDNHRDWLLHDYHRAARARGEGNWPNPRPGWDRASPDYEAWIKNLEAEGINFLVVTRVNPDEGLHNVADSSGFPVERIWADRHPERFEPLYGPAQNDPWFRLYRFRNAGRRSVSQKMQTSRTDLGASRHLYR